MAEIMQVQDLAVEAQEVLAEQSYDPQAVYQKGYTDINFFASLALPHVMISALPVFYVVVWQILVNRKDIDAGKILRFALGLPRGHAKTTFIKVIICWLIVYDKSSFALLICANEDLAIQLLSDVNDILASPNMEAVYGEWSSCLTTDTKELKKAVYHKRAVIIAAKGAGSSLRGLNIKNTRPDLIFCDDVQTRESDESPTERAKLLRWLVATLFKVVAPSGNRLIIYVGNMYSEECVLRLFQKNHSWVSLITGAILDNGLPLWPELHSLEALMESYYHDEELGLAELWFAEIMNDPRSSATSLLNKELPECKYDDGHYLPDGVFITVDPAGFKRTSDANEIILHHVYDGVGIIAGRASTVTEPDLTDPEKLVKRTLSMALAEGASLIGVEAVGYQSTLLFWFTKYMKEAGITGIHIVELHPHGRSKGMRIRLFIEELLGGNYFIRNTVRAAWIWQAAKYKLGKKENKDDLLDAVAYALDVRNEYWHLIKNMKVEQRFLETASVVGNNTPF